MDESNRIKDAELGTFIDKTQVLQEARQCFMATNIKPKKLVDILTKCIFVLLQGERLAQKEATDLFFHITRLFQYKDKDGTLRKLIYIGIKELSKQVENVYIVTSSLTTDVNSSRDDSTIRASALRAFYQISDPSKFTTIERYLKQSIVDKHPVIASAAISYLIRIATINSEAVERCAKEVQEALNSESPMVQYHALGLGYNSCKHDRLSTSRLISNCISQGLRSPLAECLLIRIIANYINEYQSEDSPTYMNYITNHLNHSSEMVEYEAANALINLSIPKENENRRSAVAHLRNFISSSKPALRFAAVRSLNRVNRLALTSDIKFWGIHRIGSICILHLLNKRYRIGDHILGILDFTNSSISCAKYTVILQCEETQQYELKQEFSMGLKKSDFMIAVPIVETEEPVLHCVLSFMFYIADLNYPRTLFEDRAGTIELGPGELDTKLLSCDFPIAIHS